MRVKRPSPLLLPLTGGAPSLIIAFSLGLTIAVKAGIFGLALGLILTSWFWKYAFILFDWTVRGVGEPPALDIQMMNPVDEQRPMAFLCIVAILYASCRLLNQLVGPAAGGSATVLFAMGAPAMLAVLALECNVLTALNPVACARLISRLGVRYVVVILSSVLLLGLLDLVWSLNWWLPVQFAASLYLCLVWFAILALLLYERRDEVGLDVWHSPERTQAKADTEELKRSAATFDEAYALMRSGRHTEAWSLITQWLESRGHRPEHYRWACERVQGWEVRRFHIRLQQQFLERLLAGNDTGQALGVVESALRRDPAFRPSSSASTLRLAHIAASGGAPKVACRLLADFATCFPGDPLLKPAALLAARLESTLPPESAPPRAP